MEVQELARRFEAEVSEALAADPASGLAAVFVAAGPAAASTLALLVVCLHLRSGFDALPARLLEAL